MYWTDENGREHTEDVYTDKSGDDVQVWVNWGYTNEWGIPSDGYNNVTWNSFESPRYEFGWTTYSGTIDKNYPIKSRGFTIDLPDGTEYGFYVKVYNGNNRMGTYYSESSKNGQEPHSIFLRAQDETGLTFLGFEDMRRSSGGDNDMNDFLLVIDPASLVIGDSEDWIIACEDLGATDDYDFNDIVFSVNHVAGSTEATVTMLAAGGVLPAYITYNGEIIGQEVHEWLGGSVNADGSYSMINTSSAGPAGDPITITVPSNFSIAYLADAENMGGFSIQVYENGTRSREVQSPGLGEAPQMICVPSSWEWPYEKVNITEAYPRFGEWGANYQSVDWYRYPADGKVLGNSN